jgi:hypothetical protein
MLDLATIFALVSAVATAPAALPSPPTALPAPSPAAVAVAYPPDGVPATSSRATAIGTAGAAAPKHSIIQFPWTRYSNTRQQNAAMEAEIDAFNVARPPYKPHE